MATIIKIVFGLALLTAAAQAGMAALTNYQFEDAVREAVLFAPRATEAEIRQTVVSLAQDAGLEVSVDNITIREVGAELKIEIEYDAEVNLLPGIYRTEWTFNPEASIRIMPGGRPKGR